jgi:hypothetical protein
VEADESRKAGLLLDLPDTGKGRNKSDNVSYEGRMALPFHMTFTADPAECAGDQ